MDVGNMNIWYSALKKCSFQVCGIPKSGSPSMHNGVLWSQGPTNNLAATLHKSSLAPLLCFSPSSTLLLRVVDLSEREGEGGESRKNDK